MGGGFCLWRENNKGGKAEVGVQCQITEISPKSYKLFETIRQARVYYQEYNLPESHP